MVEGLFPACRKKCLSNWTLSFTRKLGSKFKGHGFFCPPKTHGISQFAVWNVTIRRILSPLVRPQRAVISFLSVGLVVFHPKKKKSCFLFKNSNHLYFRSLSICFSVYSKTNIPLYFFCTIKMGRKEEEVWLMLWGTVRYATMLDDSEYFLR